eukprot:TRINITY_DN5204_c0_g2_i5.p1 TRINITY_DN5204_c0_g2~~TRINITY_DN5204_c0_g2_i5.p1  ORF type:complete len:173 (-),score=14.00 TRINITY_DN5204_c0_g2_i5:2372-2890(-)
MQIRLIFDNSIFCFGKPLLRGIKFVVCSFKIFHDPTNVFRLSFSLVTRHHLNYTRHHLLPLGSNGILPAEFPPLHHYINPKTKKNTPIDFPKQANKIFKSLTIFQLKIHSSHPYSQNKKILKKNNIANDGVGKMERSRFNPDLIFTSLQQSFPGICSRNTLSDKAEATGLRP